MGRARRLDRLGIERVEVIRAQQAPGRAGGESLLEQALIAPALLQLGRRATGPDRFADAPHRASFGGALGEELTPGRDHAGRVSRELAPVEKANALGILAERAPEQIGSLLAHYDEHGLLSSQRIGDERQRSSQEAVLTVVEERLVVERVLHEGHLHSCRLGQLACCRLGHGRFPACA